jgi:hypothetical protein
MMSAPVRDLLKQQSSAGVAGERIADMFDWVLGGALLEYDSDANVAQAQ